MSHYSQGTNMGKFLCPNCNRPLVLREGREKFYGCSGFPKCKGYFPVDEGGKPCTDKSTKPKGPRRAAIRNEIER